MIIFSYFGTVGAGSYKACYTMHKFDSKLGGGCLEDTRHFQGSLKLLHFHKSLSIF